MIPRAERRRQSLAPAFLAAAWLHLTVFVLATLFGRPSLTGIGSAVPITIVSEGPSEAPRHAEQAPRTEAAQAPTPAREETPPAAAPQPTPPAPKAPPVQAQKPLPAPKTTPDKALARARPPPPAASEPLNLEKLAADVARSRRASAAKAGAPTIGPARPETAPQARSDTGQGVTAADAAGLQQLLQRLWNPNCDVAGGESIVIPVRFTVGYGGHVSGQVSAGGREGSANALIAAAARRAIDAVHRAEPYAANYWGVSFTVNFDAKKACAGRQE